MKKYKIGIVGCGDISGIYLENITSLYKDTIEIAGLLLSIKISES